MGGEFSLYGRRKDNEKYVHLQDLDDQYMVCFKHNAIAYATDRKHELMKAIYLYKGQLRLRQGSYERDSILELTFQSAAYAEEWDSAFEAGYDMYHGCSELFTTLSSQSKLIFDYMRVYRKN